MGITWNLAVLPKRCLLEIVSLYCIIHSYISTKYMSSGMNPVSVAYCVTLGKLVKFWDPIASFIKYNDNSQLKGLFVLRLNDVV